MAVERQHRRLTNSPPTTRRVMNGWRKYLGERLVPWGKYSVGRLSVPLEILDAKHALLSFLKMAKTSTKKIIFVFVGQ